MRPDLILPYDGKSPTSFLFGEQFPRQAVMGDQYMRTDAAPHRLFKFNGIEWIHVDKNQNTSYLQDSNYIKQLIELLNSGMYNPEMLTELEEEEITAYLEDNQ
jgi:phenylalanyl-tRNA synthetase alpha subunit